MTGNKAWSGACDSCSEIANSSLLCWHSSIVFLQVCCAAEVSGVFAGLSPCFAPVRRGGVGGVGGLHLGLLRRALCIFAPRSTPNKLLLTAVTLFSQGRVAAWPLAWAAEERQRAIDHCLGSCTALQASLGPIFTQIR
jgi:hypothetical protein